tara:strand:- start:84 stop:257 length:174 start_codon:yes stop_codon:yes gene_type:complete
MSQVNDISKPEIKSEKKELVTVNVKLVKPDIKLIRNKTNLLGYNYETVLKTIFNVDD